MAASIMVWMEGYTKITSVAMSLMTTMVSVILMVTPVFIGRMLDEVPMMLCYMQTAVTVGIGILLALVHYNNALWKITAKSSNFIYCREAC